MYPTTKDRLYIRKMCLCEEKLAKNKTKTEITVQKQYTTENRVVRDINRC